MYKKVSQFLFTRARDKIPALEIDRSNKKSFSGRVCRQKISQFLFMRARDKIPALSKNLNFPDDRYIDTYIIDRYIDRTKMELKNHPLPL